VLPRFASEGDCCFAPWGHVDKRKGVVFRGSSKRKRERDWGSSEKGGDKDALQKPKGTTYIQKERDATESLKERARELVGAVPNTGVARQRLLAIYTKKKGW